MRVLHLIDPASPDGGPCTLKLLGDCLRHVTIGRHEALVIGSQRDHDWARTCGVEPISNLALPAHPQFLGWRSLKNWMRTREAKGESYDLVHGWTLRSALLAALAAPHRKRLSTLNTSPTHAWPLQCLRWISRARPTHIIASTSVVSEHVQKAGIRSTCVSMLPPGIDTESVDLTDRLAVRNRWQETHAVDDRTFVIGLLCEPQSWPDARAAATIAARLALSGRPVRLVVHHAVAHRVAAERYLRRLGYHDLLIVDDLSAQPWRVAKGLDAALLFIGRRHSQCAPNACGLDRSNAGTGRSHPSVLPLLWARAAGVQIVAEAYPEVREVFRDAEGVCLIAPGDLNAASDRLARLYDRNLTQENPTRLAHNLVNAFAIAGYVHRLESVYKSLCGSSP